MAERTEELRRDIDRTRDHMTGTIEAIGDRVSPARVVERRVGRMRRSASEAGQRIMGTPRTAAGTVRSGAGSAAGSVHDTAADVAGAIGSAPDRAKEATQGNPLAAGAVAFGLGVLIGSLTPSSREERQLAGQVMEPLKQELTAAGQEVAASVKEEVQGDVAEMKEHAAGAAQDVKAHAADAAQQVKGSATDAGGEVKDQATGAVADVRS